MLTVTCHFFVFCWQWCVTFFILLTVTCHFFCILLTVTCHFFYSVDSDMSLFCILLTVMCRRTWWRSACIPPSPPTLTCWSGPLVRSDSVTSSCGRYVQILPVCPNPKNLLPTQSWSVLTPPPPFPKLAVLSNASFCIVCNKMMYYKSF